MASIRSALAEHPEVRLVEGDGWVEVTAKKVDGYNVRLVDDVRELTIFAGPYHEHVPDAQEAFAAFMWMLTPAYRVVEELRNGQSKKSRLERVVDGNIEVLGRFGVLLPMFGKKEERVLQYHILAEPNPPTRTNSHE